MRGLRQPFEYHQDQGKARGESMCNPGRYPVLGPPSSLASSPLPPRAPHVRLQLVQPTAPELPIRLQPPVQLSQRRRIQCVYPPLRLPPHPHQTVLSQHPQMSRHARPRDRKVRRDLTRFQALQGFVRNDAGNPFTFTLDLLLCFERFGPLLDWAMIILNPLEPWPGSLCLPAAVKHEVQLITRVVDYGGLFHDDVKPGHRFSQQDHRAFRPAGWVEAGCEKMERMRGIAARHKVTMLQLACLWNLSQDGVKSVIPTLIQESDAGAKPIERKLDELAGLPDLLLAAEECKAMAQIGDNKGCMELKGATPAHTGEPQPDRWGLTHDHDRIARRWGINPGADLACTHKRAT